MLIRERRLEKGWSQEDLAAASGVSARTIQRLERGDGAGLETLKAIAAAFGTDVGVFSHVGRAADPDAREAHLREVRGLHLHLWVFALLGPVLIGLNLLVTGGPLWVLWALGFWVLGLVLHAVTVRVMHGSLHAPE